MNMTQPVVVIAQAITAEPTERHWGYDLWKKTGVKSGVVHSVLNRMREAGWLDAGDESPTETGGRRPPRRFYTLNRYGSDAMRALLYRAADDPRFAHLGIEKADPNQ